MRGRHLLAALVALLLVATGCVGGGTGTSPSGTGTDTGTDTDTDTDTAPAPFVGTNPFHIGRTLVIPHGGGDGLFPEDTTLAYDGSLAMGGDVVDVDVNRTADSVLVAFHDATTDRITGQHATVRELSYDQLHRLDAGWAFTRNGTHPFRGKGVTVPSLEELLIRYPDKLLSIDLKDLSLEVIEPLCSLLHRYHRLDDLLVGSDSDEQILTFRRRCPDVRTSFTLTDVRAMRAAMAAGTTYAPAAFVDQPPYRRGATTLVTPQVLAFAHAHGIATLTWVVDDPADLRRLVKMGVDGIYTSYPDRLVAIERHG